MKLLPNSEKLFSENIFSEKLFCLPKIFFVFRKSIQIIIKIVSWKTKKIFGKQKRFSVNKKVFRKKDFRDSVITSC